jgi:epoxyqueuosine reductase
MTNQDESRKALTARIREEARRLGFFKAGVVRAGPLPSSEHFDSWLNSGMHGAMEYMERQAAKRKDPGLVLRDARTLLVVAMNYNSGESLSADTSRGRISRYAWGDDYHQLLEERLRSLSGFIEGERPGVRCLEYVDTGPVMEKVWGAQSALGWMGKHSNLITREQGSWFFIGVILLDLELDYDPVEKDYCGSCTRCIPACPTRAIVAPYVVDARLCISYLTIELRGAIPEELRPLIGNRIFGCDDCQDVCPWNRFAVKTDEEAFNPRPGNLMPELPPLLRMTHEEFARRFKGSPVRRARRDGFVRNVAVALGNLRDPEAVPALEEALHDASPLVRAHAAWALGRIGSGLAEDALRRALCNEPDPEVHRELHAALNSIEGDGRPDAGSTRRSGPE